MFNFENFLAILYNIFLAASCSACLLLNRKDIEYKFSTSENLYALFPYVDIHITDFSTVAFELIDFRITSYNVCYTKLLRYR